MTAIAYRDGIMAADTASWGCPGSSVIVGHRRKIIRLPGGGLFAGCGLQTELDKAARALLDDGSFDHCQPFADNGFIAIWVRPDGTVWWVENSLHPTQVDAPFCACGAAETFMRGALHSGATAEQAVRLAIECTDGAAGDVQVERMRWVADIDGGRV